MKVLYFRIIPAGFNALLEFLTGFIRIGWLRINHSLKIRKKKKPRFFENSGVSSSL